MIQNTGGYLHRLSALLVELWFVDHLYVGGGLGVAGVGMNLTYPYIFVRHNSECYTHSHNYFQMFGSHLGLLGVESKLLEVGYCLCSARKCMENTCGGMM